MLLLHIQRDILSKCFATVRIIQIFKCLIKADQIILDVKPSIIGYVLYGR